MSPARSTQGTHLIERWRSLVREMEEHTLDQYEYLGALEHRDQIEIWLQITGDQAAMDGVADIDARFENVTCEDGRFADHFAAQAGNGWWWKRVPSDPKAQQYIFDDWQASDTRRHWQVTKA
jgi:hypothetical protein